MSHLRNKFIQELELSGKAKSTINNYVRAIKNLSDYHKKSPLKITDLDLKKFLHHKRKEKPDSIRTYNMDIYSIKCFYRLFQPDRDLSFCKQIAPPFILPEVLSVEEVDNILSATKNMKYRLFYTLMYSSGLRISECAGLKIKDIDSDSDRMVIRINQSKRNKDRYTPLSKYTLILLKEYFRKYKPEVWLFPGRDKTKHLHIRNLQAVFQIVVKELGIKKNVTTHTLRHSFATHLLEQKCPLPAIQKWLGHSSIQTTLIYTHITSSVLSDIKNPLDLIMEKRDGGVNNEKS